MKFLPSLFIGFILCAGSHEVHSQNLLELENGSINFVSEAPLELIKAENESFQFLIDTAKGEFALSIPISKFNGFNSALQQEHFFENYMEIDKYQTATFTGRILDDLNYRTGAFDIIVRGQLNIHGIKKERIIEANCEWITPQKLRVISTFTVPLADHNIEIPRIVFQKIAEIIKVDIQADLAPKN
ncbi:YceI family protein [Cryomorpha ignava]|uniref:YceI family protein n=1 Tax=Cryomorpha ignava TaxID=101383 RepID=A0A7K3WNC6_9FLAO|nr:YceI family protein [Cryomorpha ignava]NEN22994.1 YceI family protein [Cryomorpha ignava]